MKRKLVPAHEAERWRGMAHRGMNASQIAAIVGWSGSTVLSYIRDDNPRRAPQWTAEQEAELIRLCHELRFNWPRIGERMGKKAVCCHAKALRLEAKGELAMPASMRRGRLRMRRTRD